MDAAFQEALDRATAEVATWPVWKQNILRDSARPMNDYSRLPLNHPAMRKPPVAHTADDMIQLNADGVPTHLASRYCGNWAPGMSFAAGAIVRSHAYKGEPRFFECVTPHHGGQVFDGYASPMIWREIAFDGPNGLPDGVVVSRDVQGNRLRHWDRFYIYSEGDVVRSQGSYFRSKVHNNQRNPPKAGARSDYWSLLLDEEVKLLVLGETPQTAEASTEALVLEMHAARLRVQSVLDDRREAENAFDERMMNEERAVSILRDAIMTRMLQQNVKYLVYGETLWMLQEAANGHRLVTLHCLVIPQTK